MAAAIHLDPYLTTLHLPGSPAKVRLLALRAGLRLALFDPGDALLGARDGYLPGVGAAWEFAGAAVRELPSGSLESGGEGLSRGNRWSARRAA